MNDETKKHLYEFNKRLKKLRQEYGYSYKKLEELTGISRSTLQRYESNPGTDIQLKNLWAIADAYGISASYLAGWDSRDLPYDEYKCIVPLMEEINCKIVYHSEDETFTLENDGASIPISVKQIIDLKKCTLSYFKFILNDLISQPSTKE